MLLDQIDGLWRLGRVVNVDGDRYEFEYYGGHRINEWVTVDDLLPQSVLVDVSDTRTRTKTGIGERPIRFFDYEYLRTISSTDRFEGWNHDNIVPVYICHICGALARDFLKHYRTHNVRDDSIEFSWSWWKPDRLAPVNLTNVDAQPAKRRKRFHRSGYGPVILPPKAPKLKTPPRRNIDVLNRPIRFVHFSPESLARIENKRSHAAMVKDTEPTSGDPLDTTIANIFDEDDPDLRKRPGRKRYKPKKRSRKTNAGDDPFNTTTANIYDVDFEDDPEAGPSNRTRSRYPSTPAKRRHFQEDDSS